MCTQAVVLVNFGRIIMGGLNLMNLQGFLPPERIAQLYPSQ